MSVNLHLPRLRGHGRHHPAEILRRLTADRDTALAAVETLRADLADANATAVTVAAWVRIDNDPVDETGQVWADPGRWKAPASQHHVVPLHERGAEAA